MNATKSTAALAEDRDNGKWKPLLAQISAKAHELGFSQIGVSDLEFAEPAERLQQWLEQGFHGDMLYMQDKIALRTQPQRLVEGAVRSISVRMDYLPRDAIRTPEAMISREKQKLSAPNEAVISVYARGRDYHKVLRQRLQKLAAEIVVLIGPFGYRVFTDSAPVMEVELARKAGLGWRGKHTLMLHRDAGSFFFLGEILVDIPLPVSEPVEAHCGSCTACMGVCPTQAIIAPYQLDARRCISYLTIEHQGAIPLELRPLMGNRIYGCDDCQLFCPWNKYAQLSSVDDFAPRHGLDSAGLLTLWQWSEAEFEQRTTGSAIRRIGYSRWLRNIAVALGNALRTTGDERIATALKLRENSNDELVKAHVQWALDQRDE